jgi:hypothetical protein
LWQAIILSISEFIREESMIGLSELAAMVLVESVEASGLGPARVLRLIEEDGQFTLHIDSPDKNDHVFWYNGSMALIVDKDLEAKIGPAAIDVQDDPDEPYLAIRRRVQDKK